MPAAQYDRHDPLTWGDDVMWTPSMQREAIRCLQAQYGLVVGEEEALAREGERIQEIESRYYRHYVLHDEAPTGGARGRFFEDDREKAQAERGRGRRIADVRAERERYGEMREFVRSVVAVEDFRDERIGAENICRLSAWDRDLPPPPVLYDADDPATWGKARIETAERQAQWLRRRMADGGASAEERAAYARLCENLAAIGVDGRESPGECGQVAPVPPLPPQGRDIGEAADGAGPEEEPPAAHAARDATREAAEAPSPMEDPCECEAGAPSHAADPPGRQQRPHTEEQPQVPQGAAAMLAGAAFDGIGAVLSQMVRCLGAARRAIRDAQETAHGAGAGCAVATTGNPLADEARGLCAGAKSRMDAVCEGFVSSAESMRHNMRQCELLRERVMANPAMRRHMCLLDEARGDAAAEAAVRGDFARVLHRANDPAVVALRELRDDLAKSLGRTRRATRNCMEMAAEYGAMFPGDVGSSLCAKVRRDSLDFLDGMQARPEMAMLADGKGDSLKDAIAEMAEALAGIFRGILDRFRPGSGSDAREPDVEPDEGDSPGM